MSKLWLPPGTAMAPADGDGWQRIANPQFDSSGLETFVHRGRHLVGIRSRDEGRWHLSVSHRDRIPTWDELGFARDCLLPADAWLMIPHPPRRYWMNLNRNVLHLHEFRDEQLIERFQQEGEDAQRGGYGTPDSGERLIV